MSVLSDFKMKVDVKSSGDGFLELCDERLKGLMRSEPIADVYHVEQTPFARGKFASVRKIRHLASGVEYAAKFIRKRRRAQDTSREIRHEVAVLALCAGSPRLVRLVEVFDARQEVALVLELAAGGELQRVLDDEERLPEMNARLAMRQILEGLSHLHSRNVAHLDLKPQNLLLTEDFPNGDVKLCDFGISRLIEPGVEVREILGTPDYVAPEVLSYEPISLATDIWSVGVLAYVLLSGYSPFAGANKQETFLNISQCALNFPPELFTEVSNLAFDFIRAALVVDPKCRLTVEQCMEHPWLSDDAKLIISPSLESILSQSSENINGQLCVIIPENCHNNKTEDDCEEIDRITPVIVPLKHPHQRETAPPFPDAPSTPKVSRKSHPDSPTSVLNLCKKFQPDPPKFCPDKIINSTVRDKCETNGVYTNGKIVNVLEVCKTYDSLPTAINGKSHTKENNPLTSQNGKNSTCKTCIKYKSDIRKVSTDPTYGDCTQCEVPCCNLLSTHKHTPASINHVERAILC